jgi:hypothetical protein
MEIPQFDELTLETREERATYHAVAEEEGVPLRDIAEVIGVPEIYLL